MINCRIFRTFLLVFYCLALPLHSSGQKQEKSLSTNAQVSSAAQVNVAGFTNEQIQRWRQLSNNGSLLCGKTTLLDLNLLEIGSWHLSSSGDSICLIKFKISAVNGMNLYFKNCNLNQGCGFSVYNPAKTILLGQYSAGQINKFTFFSTPLVQDSVLVVEYFQPKNAKRSQLFVSEIGALFPKKSEQLNLSGNCEVNVSCSEGDEWKEEKRGVVRILVKEGSSLYWCSGSLMNNTQQNRIPYLLSANHCVTGCTSDDFQQFQFYFNYESDSCSGILAKGFLPGNDIQSLNGAVKLAESSVSGGSDFVLMKLNEDVPLEYQPYFNGWDISETIENEGVGIHHPSGDIKKISTYNQALSTTTITGGKNSAHWLCTWSSTFNGHGVTETGSSGSPLFNSKGYVIGTLSGGLSSCSDLTESDAYGKLSYHWNKVGTDENTRLLDWLDPTFTGLQSLHGLDSIIVEAPDTLSNPFSVQLFENPITNGILNFAITNSEPTTYQVEFYLANGKLVLEESVEVSYRKTLSYSLPNLSAGLYFLKVSNDKVKKIQKVLVAN